MLVCARATDGERDLELSTEVWLQGYRARVLMFSFIGLVIFAHVAHALV